MTSKAVLFCASATLGILLSAAAVAEDAADAAAAKAAETAESDKALEAASFAVSESATQEDETKAEINKDADDDTKGD